MTKLEPIKLDEEKQTLIQKETFDLERSLYNAKDCVVSECVFKGENDGESPLKESKNIVVDKCEFDLRYALWHTKHTKVVESTFSKTARAPFWYDDDVEFLDSKSEAVKIFRESNDIIVQNSEILSEEPFWKCKRVVVVDSKLTGFYAFFNSSNVELKHVDFEGKYSFQYVKGLKISDSTLITKDAFWHCNHVVIKDSVIKGEYIGWYSKNITFINCVIESHQPFCYAKNIKLINCKMPNCDLAFENSTVKGSLLEPIDSIKNPRKLKLIVPEVGELIKESSPYRVKYKIREPKKRSN